jgi:hypothetical protein
MTSSPAHAFIDHGFDLLPKACWYGIGAGTIPGLLWALYGGVIRITGPVPASAGPISQLIIPGLLLVPMFAVLATGLRLGWRARSVLGGLIAGLIAGAMAGLVFTLVFSAARLVATWTLLPVEARADHISPSLELLASVILDLFLGAFFVVAGAVLGSLGAFIGIEWRRRGQTSWRGLQRLMVLGLARLGIPLAATADEA